jgi:hypothetical protein
MKTITLDATQLSSGTFSVSGAAQLPSNVPQSVELKPGMHTFGSLHGPLFTFEVAVDGTIDYPAGPMDSYLAGRGTTTLEVKGYTITVDATALSLGLFAVQDASTGWGVQHANDKAQAFTGIPGSYQFGSLHGPSLPFKIAIDGTIDYPAGPMDSYLAGRGTTTLCVYGYLMGIDASRLTPPSFRVRDPSTGVGVNIDTDRFHCISLLPGTYEFACGFTLGFVVEDPGVFTYDRTLEPALSGYHTQRLHVVTDPAAVPVAA